MRRPILLGALVLGCTASGGPVAAPPASPPEGPALGRPVHERDLTAWDLDVSPDGAGLPDGSGTAREGAAVYATRCAHCHGPDGRGGLADALTGEGRGANPTVARYWPYATTLFDYLRRAMPYEAPGSLTSEETYALTAWVLHLDGIVAEDERLDRETLPRVRMPNRDGFRSSWPSDP